MKYKLRAFYFLPAAVILGALAPAAAQAGAIQEDPGVVQLVASSANQGSSEGVTGICGSVGGVVSGFHAIDVNPNVVRVQAKAYNTGEVYYDGPIAVGQSISLGASAFVWTGFTKEGTGSFSGAVQGHWLCRQ
jgi:hypothetical protein